jgi:hypothetical protein
VCPSRSCFFVVRFSVHEIWRLCCKLAIACILFLFFRFSGYCPKPERGFGGSESVHVPTRACSCENGVQGESGFEKGEESWVCAWLEPLGLSDFAQSGLFSGGEFSFLQLKPGLLMIDGVNLRNEKRRKKRSAMTAQGRRRVDTYLGSVLYQCYCCCCTLYMWNGCVDDCLSNGLPL